MTRDDSSIELNESSILRTARLVLRRPRPADAAAIAVLANDRLIADNTARIPHPYTLEHAQSWIGGGTGDDFLAFADGDLIGAAGLTQHSGEEALELGYWIGAPFRGQGFATEMARALVDYAFAVRGEKRLGVCCRVTNDASRRVIEKCGFQWFGCGLIASLGLGGAFPVDRFRLERHIWESLMAWGETRARAGGIVHVADCALSA